MVNLIGQILEQAGFKVGLTTTFNFKIGKEEKINKHKQFIKNDILRYFLD